jgi:hypothetical protein
VHFLDFEMPYKPVMVLFTIQGAGFQPWLVSVSRGKCLVYKLYLRYHLPIREGVVLWYFRQ